MPWKNYFLKMNFSKQVEYKDKTSSDNWLKLTKQWKEKYPVVLCNKREVNH